MSIFSTKLEFFNTLSYSTVVLENIDIRLEGKKKIRHDKYTLLQILIKSKNQKSKNYTQRITVYCKW